MTFSASWRQHVTWTNSELPSTHSPPAWERHRAVLAIRNFATTSPLGRAQPFTAVATLPTTVTWVSNIVRLLGPGAAIGRGPHIETAAAAVGRARGTAELWTTHARWGQPAPERTETDRSCRCLVVGRTPPVSGMRRGRIRVNGSGLFERNVGGDLLSHTLTSAVPSALEGLASGFGMGPGVTPPPQPPTTLSN